MASTYINRTLAANNQKKLTISVWVKIAKPQEQMIVSSYYSGTYWGALYFGSDGKLRFDDFRGSYILSLRSNAIYRDVGAWMHIVANFDCSISSPTAKLYVNGSEVSYSVQTIYSQNASTSWNTDYDFQIGKGSDLGGNQFNGVMSDLYFIQGYTYDASTFGETDSTTNQWKPITNPTINYGGTGGNSCHLKFENSANMDLDSGSNNLTLSTTGNLTKTEDCPDNVFATLNPLDKWVTSTLTLPTVLSNGNNEFHTASDGDKAIARTTLGMLKGKYYCEVKIPQIERTWLGICNKNIFDSATNNFWTTNLESGFFWYGNGTAIYNSNDDSYNTYGAYTNNDIVMMALDMDNYAWYLGKNGSWLNSGNPESGSSKTGSVTGLTNFGTNPLTNHGEVFFMVGDSSTAGTAHTQWNFGNGYFGTTEISSEGTNASGIGRFEYDVPTGYTALSTKGLNL